MPDAERGPERAPDPDRMSDGAARPAANRAESGTFADALARTAARSGFAQVEPGSTPTASALLGAVGGIRGLAESILPGLVFLVVYAVSHDLVWSVGVPVAIAVVFVGVRAATRSPVTPAIVGLVLLAVQAGLALVTGRAENNFVFGFGVDIACIVVLLISIAVRRPLIGVLAGLITSDAERWRAERAARRVALVATLLWTLLFVVRLAVEVPLYLASLPEALAVARLVLGVPPYAALLWVTWLLIRSVSRSKNYLDVEISDDSRG